jgi:hypothetical protein
MPRICYATKRFSSDSQALIDQANEIITDFRSQGFDLTLRQLYYQFVSRDILANRQQEYKRLGSVINDARLAGLIDWEAIVDRTRNIRELAHWEGPAEIIAVCARQFRIDKWDSQPNRAEVWVEKDALIGVLEVVCNNLDVPHFSCRGYTSQSEMWAAAQRIQTHIERGQEVHIIHLGDHDPSGIDMSRDIQERITLFLGEDAAEHFHFERIALNMSQIRQYNPPPNPAKLTDSRSTAYVAEHGDESWELDALSPTVLSRLIERQVQGVRDEDRWQEAVEREDAFREQLQNVVDRWEDIQGDEA